MIRRRMHQYLSLLQNLKIRRLLVRRLLRMPQQCPILFLPPIRLSTSHKMTRPTCPYVFLRRSGCIGRAKHVSLPQESYYARTYSTNLDLAPLTTVGNLVWTYLALRVSLHSKFIHSPSVDYAWTTELT